MGAEQVDVLCQVVPLRRHGLQELNGGPGIIHRPVAVDSVRQAVGFDGVAELVGIVPAVPVDRQSVQKPGFFQHIHQGEGPQKPKEKIQIELGVIGHQQGPLRSLQ